MSDASAVVAGRYRLEGRIAAGGMGEVWKGTDVVLGGPVAVKLLRAGSARDPGSLARFRSEARHAASLSHPGIAQVYDYGQAEPPYLVMELVDGPSLAQVLGGGPLDPGRAMDVVAQAAAGLDAAHRAGLVHRDIKPGNLLLGPGGQVKITDFGISRAAGSAAVTGTGELLGTPAYLAPERLAGQVATPASDLYSLGVLAWECLAGTPPFTGAPVEVALAHRNRPLPPLPAAVPADVAALVAELTAQDPLARPRGAGEVAGRAAAPRRDEQPGDAPAGGPAGPAGRPGAGGSGWARPAGPRQDAARPGRRAGCRRPDRGCRSCCPAGGHAERCRIPGAHRVTPGCAIPHVPGRYGAGQCWLAGGSAAQRGPPPAAAARPDGPGTLAAQRPGPRNGAVGAAKRAGASRKRDRHHRRRPTAPRQARAR